MSIFDEDTQLDAIDNTVKNYQSYSKYFINAVNNVQDLNNVEFTYNGQIVYVKEDNSVFCKMNGTWEKLAYVSI